MLFLEPEMKSREIRLTSVDEIMHISHLLQIRSLDFELLVSFSCPPMLVNWIKQIPEGQAD